MSSSKNYCLVSFAKRNDATVSLLLPDGIPSRLFFSLFYLFFFLFSFSLFCFLLCLFLDPSAIRKTKHYTFLSTD